VKLSAQRGRESPDQPVQSAYSRVAVFSHSSAALFIVYVLGQARGSGVHKTATSVIAIGRSFLVSMHTHPTPQDVDLRHAA
jgi:hypothetical protein